MEANYSILVRDAEKTIIPALRDHKMRLLPYFPLASGLLRTSASQAWGSTSCERIFLANSACGVFQYNRR